jgi:hypothetical protein
MFDVAYGMRLLGCLTVMQIGCDMSQGKHPAAVQKKSLLDTSKDVASRNQYNKTAISKSERYREIVGSAGASRHRGLDDLYIYISTTELTFSMGGSHSR